MDEIDETYDDCGKGPIALPVRNNCVMPILVFAYSDVSVDCANV